MAGHSKWAQIKRKKAVTDAKKSQVFGKLARLIAVESKRSGGDLNAPALRLALERARRANMPSENIERAVLKGKTDTAIAPERVTYEGYAPGGAALIIEGLTDNRNRTSAEIKHLLSKHGGALAEPGAAAWAFKKSAGGWEPQSVVELSEEALERLAELCEALEAHDDIQEVFTNAA